MKRTASSAMATVAAVVIGGRSNVCKWLCPKLRDTPTKQDRFRWGSTDQRINHGFLIFSPKLSVQVCHRSWQMFSQPGAHGLQTLHPGPGVPSRASQRVILGLKIGQKVVQVVPGSIIIPKKVIVMICHRFPQWNGKNQGVPIPPFFGQSHVLPAVFRRPLDAFPAASRSTQPGATPGRGRGDPQGFLNPGTLHEKALPSHADVQSNKWDDMG